MEPVNKLGKLLKNTRPNAVAGWLMILLLAILGTGNLLYGRLMWTILIGFVICIIISPAVMMHKPMVMPSWYFIILAIIPIVGSTTAFYFFSTSIPFYISVATIAMLLAAELNWFTSLKMNYKFAILLVFITTLAISGLWHLGEWMLDMHLGTNYLFGGQTSDDINDFVMYEFIYAMTAGIVAGLFFGFYFRSAKLSDIIDIPSIKTVEVENYPSGQPPTPVRKLLGISRDKQKLAINIMQAGLVILILAGILLRNLSTTVNASTGLALTFIPNIITRKYRIVPDTGLVLWLTLAIFLHTAGSFVFYDNIARWDHVTHALSASVVAAGGYTIIRAIDIYMDEIYIPPKVLFLFILMFVLATGVIWEIIEFMSDEITAYLGYEAILAQHGINDTMVDLLFDLVGAVLAATWGTAYLSDISYRLADKFEEMNSKKNRK